MNLLFMPYLLMIALISSCIELEISAPSFPDIAHQFCISDSRVGLIITYNLLGFSLASIAYGPLSECFGRRRIMIFGNGILTLGAIACVIAPSIDWLLTARFIQGIGAATSAVVVSAIIADVYKPDIAAKLYGIMNAVFSTFMALAPLLGGFISNALGWRGNYGIVALICVISWLLLLSFLPETKLERAPINFKKILSDYKTLLSNSKFLSAATVPSLIYGCYMTFVAIAPFLYMQTFKLDILSYTFHQGAIVGVFALTSVFSSKISNVLGIRKSISIALGCCLIGSGLMLAVPSPYYLTIFMSLFCIGSAILYPIIFSCSFEIFPEIKGTASSAIMSSRYFLCSGLTGVGNYFYDGTAFKLGIVIFLTTVIIAWLAKATYPFKAMA
jgi:DHA1 family bicyclomycin/chloramphenicol resistance-like MFS transporter